MPEPSRSDLLDTALVWRITGLIDGEPVLSAPVQLTPPTSGVRWNSSKRDGKDAKGQKISLDATVMVKVDIPIDSIMWLGSLTEWYGTGSGSGAVDPEVMQVVSKNDVSDLKGRETTRNLGLMRYRGTPPP